MASKAAILFVGIIVAAGLTPLYVMAFSFIAIGLLGMDGPQIEPVMTRSCSIAGLVTSFFLLKGAWNTPPLKKYVPGKKAETLKESPPGRSEP
jgi:hypothetical protein